MGMAQSNTSSNIVTSPEEARKVGGRGCGRHRRSCCRHFSPLATAQLFCQHSLPPPCSALHPYPRPSPMALHLPF